MSELNGTGIEYPTITIGGKVYTVKLTRAALYRLGKAGIKINFQTAGDKALFDFSNLVDIFHLVCGFAGTHEELAELLFDQRNEFATVLMAALGKIKPLSPIKLQEPAADQAAIQ